MDWSRLIPAGAGLRGWGSRARCGQAAGTLANASGNVTEELWSRLPKPESAVATVSLTKSPAAADGRLDLEAERSMQIPMDAIVEARTIRAGYEVHPRAEIPVVLRSACAEVRARPEVVAETRVNLENLKRKRVQLDDALKLADELG